MTFSPVLPTVMMIGCISTKEFNRFKRRVEFVSEHPEIDQNFKKSILDCVIEIGMKREMVMSILGNPVKIARESDKGFGVMMKGHILTTTN